MENITYLNVQIGGIEYNKIVSLTIRHNAGDHGYATLELEVNEQTGNAFVRRADETTAVTITTTAEGQHKTIFAGSVKSAGIAKMADYTVLHVCLVSASYQLDMQKGNKTFQNTAATHEEVMKKAVQSLAQIDVTVSDRAIGNIVMQYNETPWEFIKRMASQLNATVFPSIDSMVPILSIGVPEGKGETTLSTTECKTKQNNVTAGSSQGSSSMMTLQSDRYLFVGEKISANGTDGVIGSVECTMEAGVLRCSYGLGGGKNFTKKPAQNKSVGGRMFMGTVQAVQGDQVQVHFTDIDAGYDAGGSKWFPYSTAYSSSDGSGFYCMPEVGDTVRVFIPSNNEKDAFVASSVNKNPQANPRDKSWKAPGGKEILLTDDGIYIICENEKIFINLTKEKGIEITSDKAIRITTDSNLVLQGNEIELKAEGYINMGVGNASVYVDENMIELGAESVYIN